MLKLLVVDDESDICDFVKNFFKERDFEVFVAYQGKEAIGIIEANAPDIILLDIRMPIMDGLSTLKELRRMKNDAKVIVVSAIDDEAKVEEARRYGAVEYITKPLLLEQLERTVFMIAEQIKMSKDHSNHNIK